MSDGLKLALAVGAGVLLLAALAYWQLVLAEGVYLGRRMVIWLYDLAAGGYDRLKGYEPEMEDLTLGRPLVQRIGTSPDARVLDVGTGTGRVLVSLLRQPAFRGQAVGLDMSAGMLRHAERNLAPYGRRVELMRHDASRLPFPDAAFDAVTCLEVLEFTPQPPATLRELVRVLKPGGTLLFTNRVGVEARFLPRRTFPRQGIHELLAPLPLDDIVVLPWEVNYDQIWARRRRDDEPAAPRQETAGGT